MKTHTHGNNRGLNDAYFLPESPEELTLIKEWLKNHDIPYQISLSDVEGQDWYGRVFVEVPFGEGYISTLTQHLEGVIA